jgi:hypothetical protein
MRSSFLWDVGQCRVVVSFGNSSVSLDCFTLEDGTDRFSGNDGKVTTNSAAKHARKTKISCHWLLFLPVVFWKRAGQFSNRKITEACQILQYVSSWVQQCHFWREVKKWHQSYRNKIVSGIPPKAAIGALGHCGGNYCRNNFVLQKNIRDSTI